MELGVLQSRQAIAQVEPFYTGAVQKYIRLSDHSGVSATFKVAGKNEAQPIPIDHLRNRSGVYDETSQTSQEYANY